jgi:6-phosphogluconate dehydrogenase
MPEIQFDFGMIGLGTMGSNLLLNMADHGFAVVGFDLNRDKTILLESSASHNPNVKGVIALDQMVNLLKTPRKMMMLVPAGKPVDDVITNLTPLLSAGDIVIDGGNSHYTDTLRRVKWLAEKNIHFMGVGISGGEEGARKGPSIMPGGDEEGYGLVRPILEAVSAKVNGEPCVAYLGKDAAGHYVKMVHNGIEYAIMQLISETYWMMKQGLGFSNEQLHDVYGKWNEGEMKSFLLEITTDVLLQKDEQSGNFLVDMILDQAGAKGTGKWTSQDAMDAGVPVPSIDMAVAMRDLSSYKDVRIKASKLYPHGPAFKISPTPFVNQLQDALYFATIICYAQGLALLQIASKELKMDIPIPDVVRVWRGGCIIRSGLLPSFLEVFQNNAQCENILLDDRVAGLLRSKEINTRSVIAQAAQSGFPAGGMMSALTYFDAYRSALLPTNLIQAQRDYFGAHTYQRTDRPGIFHTDWNHSDQRYNAKR